MSTPDLGIQLAICLPNDRSSDLVSAVRQALGSSADVRTACINNSQRGACIPSTSTTITPITPTRSHNRSRSNHTHMYMDPGSRAGASPCARTRVTYSGSWLRGAAFHMYFPPYYLTGK